MTLDLGQKVYTKCKICSMDYIVSSAEDRKLHKKFHDAFVEEQIRGIPVGKGVLDKARIVRCLNTYETQEGKSKETEQRKSTVGQFFMIAARQREATASEARKKEEQSTIIEVRRNDHRSLKNLAERVLDVVENELGAVRIEKKDLWSAWNAQPQEEGANKVMHKTIPPVKDRYRVYLYIHNAHCIGLLLAERINEARKVLPPTHSQDIPESPSSTSPNPFFRAKKPDSRITQSMLSQAQTHHLPTPPPSSPMMMIDDVTEDEGGSGRSSNHSSNHQPIILHPDTDKNDSTSQSQAPLMASTTATPAALGISRIWILSPFRQSGIARALLDTARSSFGCLDDGVSRDGGRERCADDEISIGLVYEKDVIAFSQPTEMGRRFAERWWGGKDGWLVYD